MYDIFIIGAGASGMAAAVAAAQNNPAVGICIAEKNPQPGRKLAATGNGRCNITNTACPASASVREFLESIGIFTKEENEGRVYPYSEQAAQVVSAFAAQLSACGVDMLCGAGVTEVTRTQCGTFLMKAGQKQYEAKQLLIACGGKAAPAFGTTGDGYAFAKQFGHQIQRLAPVLTHLRSADAAEAASLRGIRAKGKIALFRDDEKLAEETGEIQFTETGISGIAVFNLSRYFRVGEGETPAEAFARFSVLIDFMPDHSPGMIVNLLAKKYGLPGMNRERLLETILDERLARAVGERCAAQHDVGAGSTAEDCIRTMAETVCAFSIKLAGAGGWKEAQCTAGGVNLDEIDLRTMESKSVRNLYFAGEIIDYDGPCGGYNLQNAWETGIRAGVAMAERGKSCTEYTK